MPFYVYVLGSNKKGHKKTYVGWTNNIKKRLYKHNIGKGAKSTRGRKWKIVYTEKYFTKGKAISREYYIKKNRKFRNLIKKNIA